jgi:uncharacterized protein (DUF1684 family)
MDAKIRRENSWLALAGLFWLEPGDSLVGSDPSNCIVLPGRAAAHLGRFKLTGNQVTLELAPGQKVRINGEQIEGPVSLRTDTEELPDFITFDNLRLVVIQRGDRFGVRLWDNQRAERVTYPPRAWFPVDEHYRLRAVYSPYTSPKPVLLPDASGNLQPSQMDGCLHFNLNGKSFQFDASLEDEYTLHIIFKDLTSGIETYPPARYMLAELVSANQAILDFNKAYNPPCAFTSYATCAYAPAQNWLNLRIEAGEKFNLDRHN